MRLGTEAHSRGSYYANTVSPELHPGRLADFRGHRRKGVRPEQMLEGERMWSGQGFGHGMVVWWKGAEGAGSGVAKARGPAHRGLSLRTCSAAPQMQAGHRGRLPYDGRATWNMRGGTRAPGFPLLGDKSLTDLVQTVTVSRLDEGNDMLSGSSASSLPIYFSPGSQTFLKIIHFTSVSCLERSKGT